MQGSRILDHSKGGTTLLKSSSAGDVSSNRQLPETPSHVRDQRSARSAAGYQVTRRLALAGVIAPPLFVIVFLVLGFTKPGYDPVTQFVSEGSIGELGWIQICNFLVVGLALVIFALGLWRGFGDRVSGRIGSALVGVAGVAMIGAGVFVTDSGTRIITTTGALHVVVGAVTFNSLSIACFFFAKRFWNELPFAIYLIVSGILSHPGLFASSQFGSIDRWPGIVQRVTIVIMLTWITILGLRLRRSSPGTSI
jgi:uncharacterized protein DUF998